MGARKAHMADTIGEAPASQDGSGGQAEPEAAQRLATASGRRSPQ
jgi:hypothetical protein